MHLQGKWKPGNKIRPLLSTDDGDHLNSPRTYTIIYFSQPRTVVIIYLFCHSAMKETTFVTTRNGKLFKNISSLERHVPANLFGHIIDWTHPDVLAFVGTGAGGLDLPQSQSASEGAKVKVNSGPSSAQKNPRQFYDQPIDEPPMKVPRVESTKAPKR